LGQKRANLKDLGKFLPVSNKKVMWANPTDNGTAFISSFFRSIALLFISTVTNFKNWLKPTPFLKSGGIALLFTIPLLFKIPYYPGITPFWVQLLSLIGIVTGIGFIWKGGFSPFWLGFWWEIGWFHWIGWSFIYYGYWYLVPFVIIGMGIGYGILFWLFGKGIELLIRLGEEIWKGTGVWIGGVGWGIGLIFGLPYFAPFTFDWFQFVPLLATTPLLPTEWVATILWIGVGIGLVGIGLIGKSKREDFGKNKKRTAGKIGLGLIGIGGLFLIPFPSSLPMPKLKIELISTQFPQNLKWTSQFIPVETNWVLKEIEKRLKVGGKLVVTPEVAFPFPLNTRPFLLAHLLRLTTQWNATLLIGSLYRDGNRIYNAGYLFQQGKVIVLKKHILVPFGEYIPLPVFKKEINRLFFGKSVDFSPASDFSQFKVGSVQFLQGICYEITNREIYQKPVSNLIGLSNNGWFYLPGSEISIEPIIQQLLIIKYSLTDGGKVVYHTTNFSSWYIINRGKIISWK